MLKNSLLAASLAFVAPAAFAETDNAAPRMTADQIETFSTQSADLQGSSAGVILPLMLLILVAAAVTGGD
ncbi:hypothetical protein [Aestuariivita boseongensis]|uniref:hypothetical protein n=1 Tax=Aestuariivita boseongensis TaxID=1470562 RepID=UPI000682ABDE|nr:hypothetical protein [Aestuariivita boseongensis]